jgi:hypothetical protein
VTDILFPWQTFGPPAGPVLGKGDQADVKKPAAPKPLGRRPARWHPSSKFVPEGQTGAEWLYHQLILTGPAAVLDRFKAAARGPGVIPWRLDYAAIEEDIFNLAVSQPPAQRAVDVEGCRILARQFRERVETRQAKAAALVGNSHACSFDLQVLLPIPDKILQLGPANPAALAWLKSHWGTQDRLRQINALSKPGPGRRLPVGHTVAGYGFFTIDLPPAPAIAAIAEAWPMLRFALRHRPLTWDRGWMV